MTKGNTFLRRTIMTLMAFVMLITGAVGLNSVKASAATLTRVISDEYATAYVYSDGSGHIEFNEAFDGQKELREIKGVPLKDIIQFGNGGYIDTIYNVETSTDYIYSYRVTVHGCGPSGLFNAGFLQFVDKTGDAYELSIWLSIRDLHQVCYNSDNPALTDVYWCN